MSVLPKKPAEVSKAAHKKTERSNRRKIQIKMGRNSDLHQDRPTHSVHRYRTATSERSCWKLSKH